MISCHVVLGSVGEWVAGVGTLILAGVSVWIVVRDRRFQQRTRAQRFDLLLAEPQATEDRNWVIEFWYVNVGSRDEGLRFYDVQVTLNIDGVGSLSSEPAQTVYSGRVGLRFLDDKSVYDPITKGRDLAHATATFRDLDGIWWSMKNDGGELRRLGRREPAKMTPNASVSWLP